MNFFIGAFYDGVYLLGLALNETLSEGKDIRDGNNLTRKMWNRDFHGKSELVLNSSIFVWFYLFNNTIINNNHKLKK